jgi:glycosyltransferase involved in cell wall biosynthesis
VGNGAVCSDELHHRAPEAGPLPKVALVADVRGWAFDNIADNIATTLEDSIRIETIYSDEIPEHELYERLFIGDCFSHVHFLWREPYLRFFFDDQFCSRVISGLATNLNCDRAIAIDRLADGMGRVTLTFGVYDHVHLEETSINKRHAGLAFADGYAVSSNKLFGIYASAYGLSPTVETPDGVNRILFRPDNLNRFSEAGRPLVLGWVGNSEWHNEAGNDPKGFETIVKQVIQQLAEHGFAVTADFADRKQRWRPREEMPDYYNNLDVLLCASMTEGTPNPVLEAMACGVPVITTDVGIVSEVFGPRQREFIVQRDISSMAAAVRRLWTDRGLLTRLSQENLVRIEDWDWASFSSRWRCLFEASHAQRVRGRGLGRTLYVRARCANLELGIENSLITARVAALEAAALQPRDAALQSMVKSLDSMDKSLQTILEVASWQRKMLRPIRWVWVEALPLRRQIARIRQRR